MVAWFYEGLRWVKERIFGEEYVESEAHSMSQAYYAESMCREPTRIRDSPDGIGKCPRCGGSWTMKIPHWTWYSSAAIGPLCEDCYTELSPEERWPYYEGLMEKWAAYGGVLSEEDIALIKQDIGLEAGDR